MANSFDNVLLPPGYSYGFSGGPSFDTRIVQMDGGGEQRVQMRSEPIWKWSAVRKNFADGADVEGLKKFFLARRGAFYGFKFFDPADYSTSPSNDAGAFAALDQPIGVGNGTRTRFRLTKQYSDGVMTGRDFVRAVIPMTGTASAPLARAMGLTTGDSLAPAVAVNGVTQSASAYTILPLSREVVFNTAPPSGHLVQWGGYFVVPARFSLVTDQGLESTITGFESDEAAFEIQSIPFDDEVPPVVGGSPYGYVTKTGMNAGFEVSAREAFVYDITTSDNVVAYLDDITNYPIGGPHIRIHNRAASIGSITVKDLFGNTVVALGANVVKDIYVSEDGSGSIVPVAF